MHWWYSARWGSHCRLPLDPIFSGGYTSIIDGCIQSGAPLGRPRPGGRPPTGESMGPATHSRWSLRMHGKVDGIYSYQYLLVAISARRAAAA